MQYCMGCYYLLLLEHRNQMTRHNAHITTYSITTISWSGHARRAIQCLALAKEKKLALAFQNAKKLHALAIDQSTELSG